MNKIANLLFNVLILTFALPGNSIYGIPIKQLLFISCLLMVFYHSIKFRDNNTINRALMLMILSLALVYAWFAYGTYANGLGTEASMFMSFSSLIGTCLVAHYFIFNKIINVNSAKKWVYIAAFTKILFTVYIQHQLVNNGMSYERLMEIYASLGSSPITMSIADLGMMRITTPSDSFSFVALGFLIADKRVSKTFRFITFILLTYFSIIVYSRMIFLQLGLTLIFAFIGKNNIMKVIKLAFVTFILLATFAFFFQETATNIYDSLVFRLFSQETINSDGVRDVQQEVLLSNANENPIFGKGLGYYDKQLIRNSNAKYSYELEYMAFLMQLGIVGFSLIVLLLIFTFYKTINFNIKNNIIRNLLYFNFLFWAIKPFFNPNFLSSNSASTIVVLMIMSHVLVNDKKH
jgi:hypothetical protein